MQKDLRLGGHISTKDGLSFTVATARGMSYNQMQIMTGSGRDYEPYDLTEQHVLQFKKMTYEIEVTVHLPYVINPCEDNARRKSFYKNSVRKHLELGLSMGARRFVLHPGFKKELTEADAEKNLLKFIEDIWDVKQPAELLLETDSGSKNGSAIGTPEFINRALSALDLSNTGMCLDTEHMYARGTDLWDEAVRTDFFEQFGHHVKLVHMNVPDPEVKLGGFLDRHNTAFEDRPEFMDEKFVHYMAQYPMILERSSIQIQQRDNIYIREVLGQPLEKTKA